MSEKKTVTNNEPSPDEGYIFPTGEYQGVPYFKPPVGFCEEPALKEIGEANRLNNLQAVSLPVTLFPVKNPEVLREQEQRCFFRRSALRKMKILRDNQEYIPCHPESDGKIPWMWNIRRFHTIR